MILSYLHCHFICLSYLWWLFFRGLFSLADSSLWRRGVSKQGAHIPLCSGLQHPAWSTPPVLDRSAFTISSRSCFLPYPCSPAPQLCTSWPFGSGLFLTVFSLWSSGPTLAILLEVDWMGSVVLCFGFSLVLHLPFGGLLCGPPTGRKQLTRLAHIWQSCDSGRNFLLLEHQVAKVHFYTSSDLKMK